MPSLVMKSMPKNARPATEIATVRPAKITARPADDARLGGGVSRGEPFVQELPEARDDEERVVDPDPEADHRDQDRGDGVDGRQAGQDEEEQEGRRECHDRERDRDQHRHERPEDDEQDDDRREQAQDLRGSLLDGRELGVTVVLHDHAGRLDGLANGVLHGDDGLAILLEDDAIELRLGVGDALVLGERPLAERVADAGQAAPCPRWA